ncbi:MAG: hypothetical protein A2X28_10280 [Elusimicrobia bacterium GWA2_56_46]|nr:MAG: hypothetical protein A2X28_10280 [Elusimicrobia bacterium GWA2_56_46]OGR55970.1 MAG: hypothetical protein A2X39_05230 [Elusimicrobia bacterium GWC2_56_31]HBB65950.1 hypothetical protein [Elusimicrobiota bacterium]HBW22815.1 hypothetical protein [Elusimicrobiota bacterium]
MKKLVIALGASIVFSGLAGAAGDETQRMEGGMKFAEQQISGKLDSAPSPVQLAGDFAPAEAAKCNAKAKDYSKISAKAPPPLSKEADKKAENKGASAAGKGAVVGGVMGAVVGAPFLMAIGQAIPYLATPMIGFAIGGIATAVIIGGGAIVAGAAVGYGAVRLVEAIDKRF